MTTGVDKFCKGLDWTIDIRWLDKSGFHKLSDGRMARIELYVSSSYRDSFEVTILNTKEGKIDRKVFKFDDYLDTSLTGRKDKREDYPLGGNVCFYVYKDHAWYIAEPKATRPFCAAVEAYIGMFAK